VGTSFDISVKTWLGKKNQLPVATASHFDSLAVPLKVLESCRPVTDADVPDADFVVATWWQTAEWVAQLSPQKGKKLYLIQHHETHDYLPIERVKATYRLPLHKIVIAQWLKDLMAKLYGDSKVSLIANSVDTSEFYAPRREKNPIFTVGLMYSTTTWKGVDISLKAYQIAAQTLPNLHLLAFGSEPIKENLPLPVGSTYYLRPPQEELKNLYARCDVWLFGSRLEGFGLPILEAMACRTPVIATPAGAAPELVSQGGGILVEQENPEAMAVAIIQMYQTSPSAWLAYSDRAYDTASSYTWDDATDLLEQTLQALAIPQ
jgi:glycosyltransferase involved in cell wall biosynthesis